MIDGKRRCFETDSDMNTNHRIDVIPAIDLIAGSAVRLVQGDYSRQKTYSADPVAVAEDFASAGAEWLHLVDLDGARTASPANVRVLEDIVRRTSLKVEWGGGVRSAGTAGWLLEAGASRIVCGSIAIREPELFSDILREYGPDRIVLGADVRDGKVAVNGWMDSSDADAPALIRRFLPDGLSRVVCTDISRDGMLTGPQWSLYGSLSAAFPELRITVSGGVSSAEDIRRAEALGMDSIIVGKALYEGKIAMEELKVWWQNA